MPDYLFLPQVFGDERELVERGLQILHNLGGNHVGGGQVGGILQALVLQPENIQAGLVPLHHLVVIEGVESLGFFALVAVLGVIARDEVVQVLAAQWIGLFTASL